MTPPDGLPRPPACPVCASGMDVTGLRCGHCGTEVRGSFRRCEFCALDDDQRSLLRVFLAARGNAKELERHLGVSYPTARARLDRVLEALGIGADVEPDPRSRREVLAAVASGDLPVDEAMRLIGRTAGDR